MVPANSTVKGVGRPPEPPLLPDPPIYPSPHTIWENSSPSLPRSKQGHVLLVFVLSCYSTDPSKALPKFPVWPLINYYWLKSPRPPGWAPEAPGPARGWVFGGELVPPSLGTSQPAEGSHVLAIFLVCFTCSRRTQLSPRAEPRACRANKAWFRFFFMRMATPIASWILPHSSWGSFHPSWKRAQLLPRWFCVFKAPLGALRHLFGWCVGKVAPALQSHIISVEIEAQREVGWPGGGLRPPTSVE